MIHKSLIFALAAMPLAAGCLGVAQATAMEERSQADDLARAWHEDAQLAGIVGVEGAGWGAMFAGFPFGSHGDDWSAARDDDKVGDGKCEVWMFRYVSISNPREAFVVLIDRDGDVVSSDTEPRESEDVPLGRWEVDSDEAADLALDVNEGLDRAKGSDHYGLVLVLHRDGEHPNAVWLVAGGGGDTRGGGGGMVLLDAVTGEVYENHGGSDDYDFDWDQN